MLERTRNECDGVLAAELGGLKYIGIECRIGCGLLSVLLSSSCCGAGVYVLRGAKLEARAVVERSSDCMHVSYQSELSGCEYLPAPTELTWLQTC